MANAKTTHHDQIIGNKLKNSDLFMECSSTNTLIFLPRKKIPLEASKFCQICKFV